VSEAVVVVAEFTLDSCSSKFFISDTLRTIATVPALVETKALTHRSIGD